MASRLQLRPLAGGTDISLSDLLDRLDNDPDDPHALREYQEVFGGVEDDAGFRSTSASLQSRQDRHLRRFVQAMRLKNRTDASLKDLTDDQIIQREIRDATRDQVITNMRLYLRVELRYMRPRAGSDERPRYQSLLQCRESMLFWIQREMNDRAPPRWIIINASNETLQRIGRQLGLNRNRRIKTYFGRLELAQLIDWDTLRSPYLPLTESHHLAWCFGCVCGVRPGSIGWSKKHKDQFLSFRDITITRGSASGTFNAKIQFRFLKGNRDNLEVENGLTFAVNGATVSDHPPMSIPHRLLVMLLRRNGLESHQSLESLLEGTERHIMIKEEILDDPVCRAGGPRGLSITHEALGAVSMTEYLSQHARAAGYPSGITMYCWRRKSGTEWIRATGVERAKQLMGHDTRSDTLRRYYDQGLFDVPVFEIAMRADANVAAATLDEDSPEVLMRMVDARKVKGAFLNNRVKEICAESQEYQQALSANDSGSMVKIERRARKLAEKILHDEEKKLHDSNLTIEEFERRKEQLKHPMKLVQLIRDGVRQANRTQQASTRTNQGGIIPDSTVQHSTASDHSRDPGSRPAGQPPGRGIGHGAAVQDVPLSDSTTSILPDVQGDDEFTSGLEDRDLRDDDLIDAEDDFTQADQSDAGIFVNVDATMSYNDSEEETSDEFVAAVESFMTCLGQNVFVERSQGDGLICQLCANSPYSEDTAKDKVWSSKAKLENHQMAREHSKHGEVMKRFHYEARHSEDGKYHCPYHGCDAVYTNVNKLTEHIRQSGPPDPTDIMPASKRSRLQRHDDEKRIDGWYDDDFEPSMAERKPAVAREFRRRKHGLIYSDLQELKEPKKVKINNSCEMVLGDPDGVVLTQVPEPYRLSIAFGDVVNYEHPAPISTHNSSSIIRGDDPRHPVYGHISHGTNAFYKNLIKRGDEPGEPYLHNPDKYHD